MADTSAAALDFSCACKNTYGTVQVPTSSFPLPLTLCHCNICQRQSGLLAASYVALPKKHKGFEVNGHATSYKASEDIIRYFCRTCGSNLYVEEKILNDISLCSGVVPNSGDKTRLVEQIFVSDTKDGGMSSWLPAIQGWEGFSKESKQVDCSRPVLKPFGDNANSADPELRGYCQCRSIQFKITRPTEKSSQLRGPFADLLVPQGSKYLSGVCTCNSCRTNSGFDIQPWTYIPKFNLFDMHGEPLDFEKMHDLAEYRSSEGVRRYFCSKCSATVFWCCDVRPDLIDVSVGLLDAEEGARAESWLEWRTDRISFDEDAPNRALVQSLKSGLKKWGERSTE